MKKFIKRALQINVVFIKYNVLPTQKNAQKDDQNEASAIAEWLKKVRGDGSPCSNGRRMNSESMNIWVLHCRYVKLHSKTVLETQFVCLKGLLRLELNLSVYERAANNWCTYDFNLMKYNRQC